MRHESGLEVGARRIELDRKLGTRHIANHEVHVGTKCALHLKYDSNHHPDVTGCKRRVRESILQ